MVLGLVPTHWWVRLGPQPVAGPLIGRADSWAAEGSGVPMAAGLLVDRAVFSCSLLFGLGHPRTGADRLVGRAVSQH